MALARASTKRLSWGGRLESALYRWARCFSFSRMVRVGLWFSSITTRLGNRSSDCACRIFRVRVFAPRIAGPTFLEISRSLGVGAHRDHLHLPRRKAARSEERRVGKEGSAGGWAVQGRRETDTCQ